MYSDIWKKFNKREKHTGRKKKKKTNKNINYQIS